MNGIYLFAEQIDKCREKVWKKGVEFEEGEKDLSLYIIIRHRSCSLWREWDCYSSEPKEKSSCLTNEKVMLR